MYNHYRPANRSSRVVAAAAALVTVWFLFDFVATLGDVRTGPATEARAAGTASDARPAAQFPA
jgi:hypothetical protein